MFIQRALSFKDISTSVLGTLFILTLFGATARADEGIHLSKGQKVYAPIYSHIYSGNREFPIYLAATLSIRNTDPSFPITLVKVDYYDSNGQLIKSYLEKPIQLNAMASTRYVIKESDKVGGSGANFIVQWKSDLEVNPPLIESIMISTKSQIGISFISRAIVIRETPQ